MSASVPVASSRAITLNLITMGLGTGLLTMPWGVAGASMLNAMLLLALVLVLNYWTIMILVRACDIYQEFDLGGLLRRLPGKMGPRLQLLTNGIVWCSQLLVLIGYTIVIRDSMYDLLPEHNFLHQKSLLTCIVGILVFPLCFLDQAYLSFTSTLGIMANTYLILLLVAYSMFPEMLEGSEHKEEGELLCFFGFGAKSIDGITCLFSLLMYTIIIQMAIPGMYQELETRTPEKFRRCLLIAFVCLFVIFAAVSICGYVAWGAKVKSNILDGLPKNTLGDIARAGMLVCILGCYPLNVKPTVAPFMRAEAPSEVAEADPTDDTAAPLLQNENGQAGIRAVFLPTCGVVLVTTLLSLLATELGSLNAINGAIQVVGYIGLIPGVTGLFLLSKVSQAEKAALWVLIAFSVVMAAIGAVFIDNDVAGMTADCILTM